jgi:hypothetical protein
LTNYSFGTTTIEPFAKTVVELVQKLNTYVPAFSFTEQLAEAVDESACTPPLLGNALYPHIPLLLVPIPANAPGPGWDEMSDMKTIDFFTRFSV